MSYILNHGFINQKISSDFLAYISDYFTFALKDLMGISRISLGIENKSFLFLVYVLLSTKPMQLKMFCI